MAESVVSVERIERTVKITAKVMVDYPDVAQRIMPTLKRLESERDKLRDPLDYAKQILAA
jgi:hypothetical protein